MIVPETTASDVPEQVRVRRQKYDRLVAAGTPPYSLGYPRSATLAQLRERFADLPMDTASGEVVSIAGGCVVGGVEDPVATL